MQKGDMKEGEAMEMKERDRKMETGKIEKIVKERRKGEGEKGNEGGRKQKRKRGREKGDMERGRGNREKRKKERNKECGIRRVREIWEDNGEGGSRKVRGRREGKR